MQRWGACPGLGKPEIIVESLLWMDEGLRAKYNAQKEKMVKAKPALPTTVIITIRRRKEVENEKE